MSIINKEHLEADQAATDAKKDKVRPGLTEEVSNKLSLVEKVAKELDDGKVLFYLFADLPTAPQLTTLWQWNSTVSSCKFDASEKPTEESLLKLIDFQSGLFFLQYNLWAKSMGLEFSMESINEYLKFVGSSIMHFVKEAK